MTRARPGSWCCYCKRPLTAAHLEHNDSFTFDHVNSQASGGWKRVPCCRKCNSLKDCLAADDWFWFIRNHPRWWKLFDYPRQVAEVIRAERIRRARASRPATEA